MRRRTTSWARPRPWPGWICRSRAGRRSSRPSTPRDGVRARLPLEPHQQLDGETSGGSWISQDQAVGNKNLVVARLGAGEALATPTCRRRGPQPEVIGDVAVSRYGKTYVALVSHGGWEVCGGAGALPGLLRQEQAHRGRGSRCRSASRPLLPWRWGAAPSRRVRGLEEEGRGGPPGGSVGPGASSASRPATAPGSASSPGGARPRGRAVMPELSLPRRPVPRQPGQGDGRSSSASPEEFREAEGQFAKTST